MPVEGFTDGLEPEDQNAVIWRFMSLSKFQDLITWILDIVVSSSTNGVA